MIESRVNTGLWLILMIVLMVAGLVGGAVVYRWLVVDFVICEVVKPEALRVECG